MSFDFSTSIQSFNNEFNLNAVRDYNNYLQRQDSFQFDNDINEFSKALEVASSSVPLRDKNDSWYKKPKDVVSVIVNPINGNLATNKSPKKKVIYYLKGTQPTIYDK